MTCSSGIWASLAYIDGIISQAVALHSCSNFPVAFAYLILCRGVPGRGELNTDICLTKSSRGYLLLIPFHIPHSPLSLGHLAPHHLFLVVHLWQLCNPACVFLAENLCFLVETRGELTHNGVHLAVIPSASYFLSILHSSRQCVLLCQTSTSKYCCRQRAAVCLRGGGYC